MLVFVIVVVVDMAADAVVGARIELAACKATSMQLNAYGRFLCACELQEGSVVPPGTVRSTFGMHIQTRATPRPGYVFETRFFEKAVDSESGFVRREYRLVLALGGIASKLGTSRHDGLWQRKDRELP